MNGDNLQLTSQNQDVALLNRAHIALELCIQDFKIFDDKVLNLLGTELEINSRVVTGIFSKFYLIHT